MRLLVFVETSTFQIVCQFDLAYSLNFPRQVDYTLRKGTTEVLSTSVKKIEFDIVHAKIRTTGEAMALG